MGSTGSPALICAITVRWPGMIQKNTLALMAVAIMAPTNKNAARPANQWQASHEATHTSTNTSAPTMASPFFFWPKMRQMASYSSQNTTKNARATTMAVAGAQSIFDLSMR
ncbi:hypothetical protein D3C72_1618320 [compost metagenome]